MRPAVLVDGCPGGGACGTSAAQSASTGVTLIDGKSRYVAWTQVYDGVKANDPLAHTYSQGFGVPWFAGNFGNTVKANAPIQTLLSAEANVSCNDVWDCNNRDKQDWKREAGQFYALYNGANYYRCGGTTGNGAGINRWGISVARSPSAVGPEYTDRPIPPDPASVAAYQIHRPWPAPSASSGLRTPRPPWFNTCV